MSTFEDVLALVDHSCADCSSICEEITAAQLSMASAQREAAIQCGKDNLHEHIKMQHPRARCSLVEIPRKIPQRLKPVRRRARSQA